MSMQVETRGEFPEQPSIAVVGAGAMGCYFGGLLIKAGHSVTFIDVNAAHIDHMNRQGVTLETDDGVFVMSAKAALAEDLHSPMALIVLFTKTMHTEAAMASIRHIVTPKTVVLCLQNGLGNAERIGQFVDIDRVAVGTTLVPADLKSIGHVVSHGPSDSLIMDASLKHPQWLDQLTKLLNNALLTTRIEPDIYTAIWSKVAFNAALNAICTLVGSTPGYLAVDPDSKALARCVVHETVLVGQANDVHMDESDIWNKIEMAIREHPDHKPSMLQDIEAGRETEILAINGAIVAVAAHFGMEAPINRTLTQLVKSKERVACMKKQ